MNRTKIIALLVGVAAILVFVLYLWHASNDGNFVSGTIDYVVSNLSGRSGLSPFLMKGIVVLVTIPFFWAVAMYTKGFFGSHDLKPSLQLYRSGYGIVIVCYVGFFFVAMYFASLHAYAYKWCADTPEGIRTFDGSGTDPVYGFALKPCTPDQMIALRQAEIGFSGPRRIQAVDPGQYEFFDTLTGKERVWYYRAPDGQLQLFDRPGKSPATGEALRVIDREAIQELVRLRQSAETVAQRSRTMQEESDQQRKEQDAQARQRQAEEVRAKQESDNQILVEKQAEMSRLRSRYDETMARATAEVGFWKRMDSQIPLRTDIRSALNVVSAKRQRCGEFLADQKPTDLDMCLKEVNESLNQLDRYK